MLIFIILSESGCFFIASLNPHKNVCIKNHAGVFLCFPILSEPLSAVAVLHLRGNDKAKKYLVNLQKRMLWVVLPP